MGSSPLPLHVRKEKDRIHKSLSISNILKSPKRLVATCIVFFIILYTFSSTKNMEDGHQSGLDIVDYNINPLVWAPSISERIGKSAYPKSYFTPDALKENDFYPVSAVILRVTDDDESIVYTVKNLIKYPFISDIYIHNTIKKRPLQVEDLKLDSKIRRNVHIEVIESDEELLSMARFTSCATASRSYCYFQDDTYLNPYMDSLYTNFLRFPTLIHANTKPSHYELNMKWRFSNDDIRLHTGYADFRYGAFVPRWKVQTFLTQLGKSSLDKSSIRQAEHYFAIWMNQYPWLLSNPPHLAKGDKATDQDIAYPETLDLYTFDAVRHLQRSLTNDQSESPQDYFAREEELPVLEHRDVRSSCANDRCLFMTNIDPFISPKQLKFDYRNSTSIAKWETEYDQISKLPPQIEWEESSYHKAIDSDPSTCWNTIKDPKRGDYFGLILVGTTKTNEIVIHTNQEIKHAERVFSVSVLQSESNWVDCKVNDKTVVGSGRVTLGMNCPSIKYYRAVKVTFTKDQTTPFEVCSLSIDNLSV